MPGILYDASKIKVCQAFYEICTYAELDRGWTDELWEHHDFVDSIQEFRLERAF